MTSDEIAGEFNSRFPVGTMSPHRETALDGIPFVLREVKSPAIINAAGKPMAFFKGLHGGYLVTPDFIDYSQPRTSKA